MASKKQPPGKVSAYFKDLFLQKELILLILPGVVLVFIFNYIPIYGIVIAFQKYSPVGGFFGSEWVGLKYFQQFLENPYLFRLVRNTFLLGLYSLLWGFPAPIILAILLDQLQFPRFKKIVQSISYFPYFISTIIVVGIVNELCSINGVFNQVRELLGYQAISFITNPSYFRTMFVSSGIWQGVGWGTIIYLAAISNVDPELHEAATIDGANRFQRIRYITWPAIIPTTEYHPGQ